MQTYIKSMAWAFWRERRSHVIFFIALALAFSLFTHAFSAVLEQYEAMQLVVIFAVMIEGFGLAGVMIIGIESQTLRMNIPDHLYARPVPTRSLIGTYFGLTILTVLGLHLTTVLLYQGIGQLDWPVVVPLLGLTTLVLCVHAAVWTLSSSPLALVIGCMLICGSLGVWGAEHVSGPKSALGHVLSADLPGLVLAALGAIVLALYAVKQNRCGEGLHLSRFWEGIRDRLVPLLWPQKTQPFRTPQVAHFWLLLRWGGCWIMPVINGLAVVTAVVLLLVTSESTWKIPSFMIGCAAMNLFVLPFVGAVSVTSQGPRAGAMSHQVLTRPLGNGAILTTMAKAFLVSYAAAWAVYGLGLALLWLTFLVSGAVILLPASELGDIGYPFTWPKVLVYLVCLWTAVGLTGSLVLTGRRWPVLALCGVLVVVPNIMALSAFLDDAAGDIILGALAGLFAVFSVGGTAWAYLRMVQKRLWSLRLAACLVIAYLAGIGLCVSASPNFLDNTGEYAAFFGLLALPFAPLATAPLALAWNRHR